MAKDYEWVRKKEALKSYHRLGLKPTTRFKSIPEMVLKKEVLDWLIAAKSGHGHFADYHERFGYKKEDIHADRGDRSLTRLVVQAQEHLNLSCLV